MITMQIKACRLLKQGTSEGAKVLRRSREKWSLRMQIDDADFEVSEI